MLTGTIALVPALLCGSATSRTAVWDHPGHMTTAAVAFLEIERLRPDLIEKLGLLFLVHPDPTAFGMAAGDAKGKERVRRQFIEAARWPDDAKFTVNDRPTWHSARWPIVAEDAPPEVKEAASARAGKPRGQAIEALTLNYAVLENPESVPAERARALCWVFHIVGDIHQPLHVSDLFSKDFPAGNAAGTLSYVQDPLGTTIPLHLLWDSNVMRSTNIEEIGKYAKEFTERFPRSSFPELTAHPVGDPDCFLEWAQESHKVAVDWAYAIATVADPNMDQDADRLVRNMVRFITEGISPVAEAPAVPDEYWQRLQVTAAQRITLAGYRIADLVIAAADNITTQRAYVGR